MSSKLTYPKVVADTANMSRPEWLQARRFGIGGSDAAAILGVSPWASKYSLYLDKTSAEPVQKAETAAMRFGNIMEPVVAELFAEQTGMTVTKDTNLYRHPEHEFMLANLDGVVSTTGGDVDALLEVKTSRYQWKQVPDYYVSQVQHYMAVTGMPVTYVAALFNGEEFTYFEIPRDDKYIDRLVNLEGEFWRSVQKQLQPDIDGSEATYNAVRKQYDAESGLSVELSADVAQLIEERAQAKALVDQYEAMVREAESKIMTALGQAEVGTIAGKSVVTWKSQSRSSVDAKALKEAHPEIAKQFMKESSFRVLRVK
jgi:putative phage-type endonuclease